MSVILSKGGGEPEDRSSELENRLRERRQAAGLSQQQLADLAGITRQAVSALEGGRYSPATSVALQLARALGCRLEELFSLKSCGEIVEGELLGEILASGYPVRAQVSQVGHRVLVRPLAGVGELTGLGAAADGVIVGAVSTGGRVRVELLKERETVGRKIVVGGCDPAMFLADGHIGRREKDRVAPCLMGSGAALGALGRGEIHVAGVHLAEEESGTWKLPDLKRALGKLDCIVITFAHWEEGFVIRPGNPKRIRAVADVARPAVRIVNREKGSGARRLLDKQLRAVGINPARVKGYGDEVLSHLEVAWRVKSGLADAGIGVRAVASIAGLDFVPLQRERYDLVIPKAYYETLHGLQILLDTIVSRPFRSELDALGGYDSRETGKRVEMPK